METAKKVIEEVGQVTILLNNAGIMPQHPVLKHSEQEIRLIYEINVLSHFWVIFTLILKINILIEFLYLDVSSIFTRNVGEKSRTYCINVSSVNQTKKFFCF